jgi:hypothetical protein
VKYWEIIADDLNKARFSLAWSQLSMSLGARSGLWTRMATGSVSSCGPNSLLQHRSPGNRSIVRAHEMLTAFVELERAIQELAVALVS